MHAINPAFFFVTILQGWAYKTQQTCVMHASMIARMDLKKHNKHANPSRLPKSSCAMHELDPDFPIFCRETGTPRFPIRPGPGKYRRIFVIPKRRFGRLEPTNHSECVFEAIFNDSTPKLSTHALEKGFESAFGKAGSGFPNLLLGGV
jgi:hypothetical protein